VKDKQQECFTAYLEESNPAIRAALLNLICAYDGQGYRGNRGSH
jgi:hypothetical protein